MGFGATKAAKVGFVFGRFLTPEFRLRPEQQIAKNGPQNDLCPSQMVAKGKVVVFFHKNVEKGVVLASLSGSSNGSSRGFESHQVLVFLLLLSFSTFYY